MAQTASTEDFCWCQALAPFHYCRWFRGNDLDEPLIVRGKEGGMMCDVKTGAAQPHQRIPQPQMLLSKMAAWPCSAQFIYTGGCIRFDLIPWFLKVGLRILYIFLA